MAGPGTAGLDAAMGSLLRTGEKVLILSNGFFGSRLVSIARSYGLEVLLLEFPAGQPVDPDVVRARLDAERDLRAVAMVHHETSTGVLNPLREVTALAHEWGLPIIVDAIASVGGVPIPVDEWGLDVVSFDIYHLSFCISPCGMTHRDEVQWFAIGGQIQDALHLVIVESANGYAAQPQCHRLEQDVLADVPCL